MQRITAAVLALALCLGAGCSGSESEKTGSAADGSTIQARELSALWADILAQRDRIQVATAKKHQMWHEECAEVSSAAAELEKLATEMNARVAEMPSLGERRNGVLSLVENFEGLIEKLRVAAIHEVVGELPGMMISLDAYLRGLEGHFTPQEIGSESVANRPGFNPVQLPSAASPI
jgi:hypothetical protein